ncbi:hypothetical protein DERP_007567 [Dermatophagoides pteronyssinus]|uniref:Uncharacterized protein n=1 Tax=Dermatophagoides pteronyssinus TaxID=6956 RepID=A0ABQ8JK42_DERPT|nr:hypothetical protein DERP_007567 [Dermatophagoides pteronyssinus]
MNDNIIIPNKKNNNKANEFFIIYSYYNNNITNNLNINFIFYINYMMKIEMENGISITIISDKSDTIVVDDDDDDFSLTFLFYDMIHSHP